MTRMLCALLLSGSVLVLGCNEAKQTEVRELSQQELLADEPAGALILDVRTSDEFDSGHVPDAMNIPHDELSARLAELDADLDRPIVVYCQSGRRAGLATSVLLEQGYRNVFHLTGDMNEWKAKGLPLE